MEYLIRESERRRRIQNAHNEKEGIKPTTIYKSVDDIMSTTAVADSIQDNNYKPIKNRKGDDFSNMDKQLAVDMMRTEMLAAAENLEFEKAAKLRDEIQKLEKELEGIF
jgi:excinuclease ABC subunit B